MDFYRAIAVLAPVIEIDDVSDWNNGAACRLAELIEAKAPRTADDLTVRELLELMNEVKK